MFYFVCQILTVYLLILTFGQDFLQLLSILMYNLPPFNVRFYLSVSLPPTVKHFVTLLKMCYINKCTEIIQLPSSSTGKSNINLVLLCMQPQSLQ